ncbi:MAG: DNA methylase [Clostridia bacterium]|nr:DNA methylase [Clostridia bacterium]
MEQRTYIAIDLKSFYASVECVERGLDPMNAHLVVADESRTEKTICLAVSPALKAQGIPGRPRLFEVIQRVRAINADRQKRASGRRFQGASHFASELQENANLALDYFVAPPRMAFYIEYSTRIYQIYLNYVDEKDIHVYSIDEVFIDATEYLKASGLTARDLAMEIILDVLRSTGITATAGIGPNLYLCKVAMDVWAKHIEPDENGVRIAELDEMSYRRQLWNHRPLTDFWRVGRGYARKLEEHGMFTMGDVARQSVRDEDVLYDLFGVNAELLIDHAWGWEPCAIADIKAYRPDSSSIGSGQVLSCPYSFGKARLVVREMADALALELVDKRLTTDQLVLDVGYDNGNVADGGAYTGEVKADRYGRRTPKPAHGTQRLERRTSSARRIAEAALELYDRIVDPRLSVRRLNLAALNEADEREAVQDAPEQLDMFTDYAALEQQRAAEEAALAREKQGQQAILEIRRKFGKNAILKGTSLMEGATARDRNRQIGGHKA